MAGQSFMDAPYAPPNADLTTYSTVTTEALLWTPALWTPINAMEGRVGKMWRVTAGGIITLPATTGSVTLTPRFGLLVSSPSLGASGALFSPGATTNRPWILDLFIQIRAVAVAGGGASTAIAWGGFWTQGLLTTGAAPFFLALGGTAPTNVDVGVATGIGVTIIWGTTAGSITPHMATIQPMN